MKRATVSLLCAIAMTGIYGQNLTEDSIRLVQMESLVITSIRATDAQPVTQVVTSREEIDRIYAGQDPAILLSRFSPSMLTFSDAGLPIGNYNQFRIRGIDQTRINITLNGVPLNDMIDQGVFFSNFQDFGSTIASVQTQRGVGTSSNGVASYGGSVNFESARLNQEGPSGSLEFTGGSYRTFRKSLELSTGKMDNNLAFYSRFSRIGSDGYKRNSGSDAYSFFMTGGYIGDRDIIKVTALAGKTENDQSYLPVLLTDIEDDPRTNYNHPNDTDDFEQQMFQLQYSRILNDDWTLNATAYYGGANGVFPFGLDDTTQLTFGLRNDHFGFLTDGSFVRGRTSINLGIHTYTFLRENFNGLAPNSANPSYEDNTTKNEFTGFAKLNYDLGNLSLFADLQGRYVNLIFEGAALQTLASVDEVSRDWFFLNPKVGINYVLNGQQSIYASFGRTGREPTRTDILQGDGSGIFDYNVSSLTDESVVTAEYVNDIEVGYRWAGRQFETTTNIFYMTFEDEISAVGALAARSYVPIRINVSESERVGVETVTNYQLNDNIQLGLTASYLSTQVSSYTSATGDSFSEVEQIFSPNWIISPMANFSFGNLQASIDGRYVSESFMELSNDPEFALPSFFVMNAQVGYQIINNWKVTFQINNLLDELYFTEGSPVDIDFDGIVEGPGYRVQPPRNFFLTTSLSF